jgi:hypothetical protein
MVGAVIRATEAAAAIILLKATVSFSLRTQRSIFLDLSIPSLNPSGRKESIPKSRPAPTASASIGPRIAAASPPQSRRAGGCGKSQFVSEGWELGLGIDRVTANLFVRRAIALLFAAFLALAAMPASAAVSITFYSKELGASFPHAFVILEGNLDRGGPRIEEDYGFTAKTISPAILWGKVAGEVITDHTASYVKGSDRHFTLTLSDAEYDRVMATIARWRSARQPSYDLDKHNCVHFVAEIAAAIGMTPDTRKLIKKPRSFLETMTAQNRAWLTGRNAVFHRGP